jgi:hypothetical protein
VAGKSEPVPIVVCDAGPLIHFDELACLSLLNDFLHILVPDVVWDEVRRHRPSALRRGTVSLERIEQIPEAESDLLVILERRQRTRGQVLNLLRAVRQRSTLFVRADFLEALIQRVREMK